MKNFWYLFAAYTIIWTVLFGYVLHLSRRNRELRHEVHELRAQIAKLITKDEVS